MEKKIKIVKQQDFAAHMPISLKIYYPKNKEEIMFGVKPERNLKN